MLLTDRHASERGWALVSVLWGLVIISLIAAVMLSSARVSYRQAVYSVEQAQRQARAEAATARAVLGLLDTREDHRWRVDGVAQAWVFDGQEVQVAIQDEGGKIDLNAAGEPAIRQLLGVIGPAPVGMADKILDWRDQHGELHRLNGATSKTYSEAGRDYVPRGGPYQSIDELKLTLDMTSALYERLKPAVTVYSGRSKVNPTTAPKEVLMALLGQNDATASAAIAARNGSVLVGQTQGQPIIGGRIAMGIPIEGWTFSVRVRQPKQGNEQDRVIRISSKTAQRFDCLDVTE